MHWFLRYKFYGIDGRPDIYGTLTIGNAWWCFSMPVLLWQNMTVDHQCQSLIQNSHQTCLFECRCTLTSVFFISAQVTNCPTSNLDLKNWPVGSLHNCTSFSLVWEARDLCVCLAYIETEYWQQKFSGKSEVGMLPLAMN